MDANGLMLSDFSYNLEGKRIFVAGHRGMVGAAVLRALERQSQPCVILTAGREVLDLRDQGAVDVWMREHAPDAVILCAAKVGGIMANSTQPANFFYDNIMISTNVLHGAYKAGVERLLFLGSSCIYPRACAQPIREEYLLSGALEGTNEGYALAKIGGLKMAQYYRAQYGCDFISAMPCNLYGVGDMYHAQNSHVIPAMIMKAHKAKIEGAAQLSLWGSGAPLREFLYVDDLADRLVLLLKHYSEDVHINVGSGEEISIADLAHIICDVVGYEGGVVFDRSKPDGMPRKLLDNSKISALLARYGGSFERGDFNARLGGCYQDYLTSSDMG